MRHTYRFVLAALLIALPTGVTGGTGKRVLPNGVHATFRLTSATPYPSGVVGLHYTRQR